MAVLKNVFLYPGRSLVFYRSWQHNHKTSTKTHRSPGAPLLLRDAIPPEVNQSHGIRHGLWCNQKQIPQKKKKTHPEKDLKHICLEFFVSCSKSPRFEMLSIVTTLCTMLAQQSKTTTQPFGICMNMCSFGEGSFWE